MNDENGVYDVDEAFFFSSLFTATPGKTYLTVGQDLFSIQEYVNEQYNASLHRRSMNDHSSHHREPDGVRNNTSSSYESFVPAGVMVYTDIQTLNGLDMPTDYGSGIEYADGILGVLELLPPFYSSHFTYQYHSMMALQVGLWLDGSHGCRDIMNGTLDTNIQRMFDYFMTCPYSKIFLRVGYEFDNPSFGYSDDPQSYVNAFQKIVRVCDNYHHRDDDDDHSPFPFSCREKIVFVWHSWGASINDNYRLEQFYPGDEYVDWIGISIFQQFFNSWNNPLGNNNNNNAFSGGTMENVYQVLDFATNIHPKPIMIGESTPFGGIRNNPNVASSSLSSSSSIMDSTIIWKAWFQPLLQLIEQYDISMLSYINCNWESLPMWNGVGFGDTRLSIDTYVMEQWNQHVLQNPRFLSFDNVHQHNHNHSHHHDHSHPHPHPNSYPNPHQNPHPNPHTQTQTHTHTHTHTHTLTQASHHHNNNQKQNYDRSKVNDHDDSSSSVSYLLSTMYTSQNNNINHPHHTASKQLWAQQRNVANNVSCILLILVAVLLFVLGKNRTTTSAASIKDNKNDDDDNEQGSNTDTKINSHFDYGMYGTFVAE